MIGKEIAKLGMKYPDFEFEFRFTEDSQVGDKFLNLRSFENLKIADIGYSGKVVLLSGEEC